MVYGYYLVFWSSLSYCPSTGASAFSSRIHSAQRFLWGWPIGLSGRSGDEMVTNGAEA